MTSIRKFLRENREEIDKFILSKVEGVKLNDHERELWLRNDEGLYLWARSEGVRI